MSNESPFFFDGLSRFGVIIAEIVFSSGYWMCGLSLVTIGLWAIKVIDISLVLNSNISTEEVNADLIVLLRCFVSLMSRQVSFGIGYLRVVLAGTLDGEMILLAAPFEWFHSNINTVYTGSVNKMNISFKL